MNSFLKRYWWFIAGALSLATLGSAITIVNTDGYLNITNVNQTNFTVNQNLTMLPMIPGHLEHLNGTAPQVSNCGTSPPPTIVGNDNAGTVTVGTGVITSCSVNFSTAWTNSPACITEDASGVLALQTNTSTTGFTITSAATIASAKINYLCGGWK